MQEFYNSDPVGYSDKTDELYSELSTLKDSMMENLDKAISRSGKIEVTLERSDSLVQNSRTYKRRAKKVYTTQRNRKYMYIIALIIAIFVSKNENCCPITRNIGTCTNLYDLVLWNYIK